ncbi:hypothetical protein [Microbacterium sp. Root180]|uniref:hypothetical protein n=1 Tax=Microbacterium sp. Root180 TaxID=1736483 RepID=UPI0006FFC07E|nr:hypothetical protein [Microbacterium sp. Root180]KRB35998.1 hypothetical protein ASD93_07680 [Microbacterium sp. Root180]
MSDIDSADAQALTARIRELESENARLAADAPAKPRPTGSRWRAIVSAICIVVAAILVPVSIVSAWARVQLVEEDAFVATLAPLVDDAAVQSMIIDETMEAVNAKVDFHELTANVFDGITSIDGFPPRAAQALGLLQAPAADGLENLVNEAVTRVVRSDAFSDVWATATRAAHRALTTAATSDGGGLVVRTDEGVGIQLGAIVDNVKQRLVDRGVSAAQLIPEIDRVVIIGEGDNLAAIRTAYALATTLGWWLPVITLVLFGLGIAIARRRSVAVLGTGLAIAIGAGALAVTLSIGDTAVGIVAGDLSLSPSALNVIYDQLVASMAQTAVVLSVLGVFVALLGWAMGRSAAAEGARGAVRGLNSSARRQLASRGLDTGGFGGWLARHKVLVRTAIAVLAVLWLFALRPLSFGDIVLVIVVAFVVAWILELLQRRAEEHAEAEAEAEVEASEIIDPDAIVVVDEVVVVETADAATTGAAASTSKKGAKG